MEGKSFKDVLRNIISTVSIVTLMDGERRHGFTLSSFMNISITPATIAISVNKSHTAHNLIKVHRRFAFNALNNSQENISNRFAYVKDGDRFDEGSWGMTIRNMPILKDAVFWLDCDVVDFIDVHTHTIFIGEVRELSENKDEYKPLIYGQGMYQDLK